MKSVAKGFLIGCSVLLVLGIAAIGAFVWFAKTKGEAWVKKADEVRKDAQTFGQSVPESRCLTEAAARYKKDPGIVSGIEQRVWLGGCLEPSTFEPAFCEGVPPEGEITKSATWRVDRCNELGLKGDSTCPNILA